MFGAAGSSTAWGIFPRNLSGHTGCRGSSKVGVCSCSSAQVRLDARNARPEQVIDEAIAALGDLETIREIVLSGAALTDDRLLKLRSLRSLTLLDISFTRVTSRGLAVLQSFPELRHLNLSNGSGIDDRALVVISQATELEQLGLRGTSITDDGLRQLTSLRKLRVLYLDHTEIHDEGLAALAGLPSLEHLEISGCQVTDEGIAALRHALPHLEIYDD